MTCLRDIPRLDCFRLLKDLDDAGVNNAEVARRLGLNKSVIFGWKAGAEPAWSDGERLRELHAYATSEVRENEPRSA